METVAFMRLHSFDVEPIDLVINRVAQYVDGIFFLVHNLQNPKLLEAAERHPKCCEIRHYPGNTFDIDEHRSTLSYLLDWAGEIKPKYVLEFDEDEIPPDKFDSEFEKFKKSDSHTMYFRFFWPVDDIDNIILAREGPDTYFPHLKVYKWNSSLESQVRGPGLIIAMCNIYGLIGTPKYLCPFPQRHLAILTPRMREIRFNRKELTTTNLKSLIRDGKHWWNTPDLQFIQYDKDMTWKTYTHEARIRFNKIKRDLKRGLFNESVSNHK